MNLVKILVLYLDLVLNQTFNENVKLWFQGHNHVS